MGDHQSVSSPQPQPLRPTHSPHLTEQNLQTSPSCNKRSPSYKTPAMPQLSIWPEHSVSRETSGGPQAAVNFKSTAAAAAPSTSLVESSKITTALQFARNARTAQYFRTFQAATCWQQATESGRRVSGSAAPRSPPTGSEVTAADTADDRELVVVGGETPQGPGGDRGDDGGQPHPFAQYRLASQTRHFVTRALGARTQSMPPPLLLLPEAPSGPMLSPPPQSRNPRELLRNRSSVGVVVGGGALTPATPITPAAIHTPRNADPCEYETSEPHCLKPGLGSVLGRRVSKPAEAEPPERPRTQDVSEALRRLFPYNGSRAEAGVLQSHDGNAVAQVRQDEPVDSGKDGRRSSGGDGSRLDGSGGANEDETQTETETVTITVTETDGETDTAAACTAGKVAFSQLAGSMEAANPSLLPTPFGGQMPSRLQSNALHVATPPPAPATAPPPKVQAAKQSTEGSTTFRFIEAVASTTGLQQRLAIKRPPSTDPRASPTKQKRAISYSPFTSPLRRTSSELGRLQCGGPSPEVTRPQALSEPGGLEATLGPPVPPPSFLPPALAMPPPRAQFKQQQRQLQQQQQQVAQPPLPQTAQQVNLQQDEQLFFPMLCFPQQGQAQAPGHHVVGSVGDKGPGDSGRGADLPPPIHVTVAAAKRPRSDQPCTSPGTSKRRAAGLGGANTNDQAGAAPGACTTDASAADAVANPGAGKLDEPHGAHGSAGGQEGALTPPSASSQSGAASTTALTTDFAFVRQRRTVNLAGFTVHLDPGMVCEVVGLFHPMQYMAGAPCIEYPPGSELFISRSHFEKIGGSLTAKWYRSLRVIPSLEALGDWLQRQHLPVFKGCPRRSQKAAAAEVATATANTGGTEAAQRPRKATARSDFTTPEPQARPSARPTAPLSAPPPTMPHEEATATDAPAAAPTIGPTRKVAGNGNSEETARPDPRAGPETVPRHWPPSHGDLSYNVGAPRPLPPGALPLPVPTRSWLSTAAPTRAPPLAGALPALSSSALYDRACMRPSQMCTDPIHSDHQSPRGLLLYGVGGPPAWAHRRLAAWAGDLDPDQQQPLRRQTVNAALTLERSEEGGDRDGAAGTAIGIGGCGGDRIGDGGDGQEGALRAMGSGQRAQGDTIHDAEEGGVKEGEAGSKSSAVEAAGRTGFGPYGGRIPPFARHLYGMAPLTKMTLQEFYGSANLVADGEPVSFHLIDAMMANEAGLRPYGTASLAVVDEPPASRRERTSSGSGPGSAGGGISDRRTSNLEACPSATQVTTGDQPPGPATHSFFSCNLSPYKRQVPYTYPSPYILQPRRGVPTFWASADGGASVRGAAAVAVDDERRCSNSDGGSGDIQGPTTDVSVTAARRPMVPPFPPLPHPLLSSYYYGPRAVGRPIWRSKFPFVHVPVPPPGRPGHPGSSSTLAGNRWGSHLASSQPPEDENTRVPGNPEFTSVPERGLSTCTPADSLHLMRLNWSTGSLPPPQNVNSISASSGLSFPGPVAASILQHLSERATIVGTALELDPCTTSSSARRSTTTAVVVESPDDDLHGPGRAGRPIHIHNAPGVRQVLQRHPLSAPSPVSGRVAAIESIASETHAAGLPLTQLQRGRLSAQSLPTAPAPRPVYMQAFKDSDSPHGRAPPPPPSPTYSLLPNPSGHQLWPPQLSGQPHAVAGPPYPQQHPQQQQHGAPWRLWSPLRGSSLVAGELQQERPQPSLEDTEQGRGTAMELGNSAVAGRGRRLAGRKRKASGAGGEPEREEGAPSREADA